MEEAALSQGRKKPCAIAVAFSDTQGATSEAAPANARGVTLHVDGRLQKLDWPDGLCESLTSGTLPKPELGEAGICPGTTKPTGPKTRLSRRQHTSPEGTNESQGQGLGPSTRADLPRARLRIGLRGAASKAAMPVCKASAHRWRGTSKAPAWRSTKNPNSAIIVAAGPGPADSCRGSPQYVRLGAVTENYVGHPVRLPGGGRHEQPIIKVRRRMRTPCCRQWRTGTPITLQGNMALAASMSLTCSSTNPACACADGWFGAKLRTVQHRLGPIPTGNPSPSIPGLACRATGARRGGPY